MVDAAAASVRNPIPTSHGRPSRRGLLASLQFQRHRSDAANEFVEQRRRLLALDVGTGGDGFRRREILQQRAIVVVHHDAEDLARLRKHQVTPLRREVAKDAFEKAAGFLQNDCSNKKYAIIGYQLSKTLSEHGTVSRGVCEVNAMNDLVSIKERTKIYAEGEQIVFEENDIKYPVPFNASVSMNFWCFHPAIFEPSEKLFHDFLSKNAGELKAEFFIPIIAEDFMHTHDGAIKVIPTSSQWFGVTYKEDAPGVQLSVENLVKEGEYPVSLWATV